MAAARTSGKTRPVPARPEPKSLIAPPVLHLWGVVAIPAGVWGAKGDEARPVGPSFMSLMACELVLMDLPTTGETKGGFGLGCGRGFAQNFAVGQWRGAASAWPELIAAACAIAGQGEGAKALPVLASSTPAPLQPPSLHQSPRELERVCTTWETSFLGTGGSSASSISRE